MASSNASSAPIDITTGSAVYNPVNFSPYTTSNPLIPQESSQYPSSTGQPGLSGSSFSKNASAASRKRRESFAHSQGVGGVSWGTMSVGSWLRDEVMTLHQMNNQPQSSIHSQRLPSGSFSYHSGSGSFSGTSGNDFDVNMNSPPAFPSAYLPNLEATYCKDYSCCGQLLSNLHELLRHYEEAHVTPTVDMSVNSTVHTKKRYGVLDAVSTNDVFLSIAPNNGFSMMGQHTGNGGLNGSTTNNTGRSRAGGAGGSRKSKQVASGVPGRSNIASNPTSNIVVNRSNKDSVIIDDDEDEEESDDEEDSANMKKYAGSSQINNRGAGWEWKGAGVSRVGNGVPVADIRHQGSNGVPPSAIGSVKRDSELYVSDPSRQLYTGQEEVVGRPFKCPVRGCDKNYKNQNGLKYHRLHGHRNQMLHLNGDGTYSVVDPDSEEMLEKDKPYKCEVCGRRYKNLNGLKYHRGHSTH